jgi:hypothetical protein
MKGQRRLYWFFFKKNFVESFLILYVFFFLKKNCLYWLIYLFLFLEWLKCEDFANLVASWFSFWSDWKIEM